MSEGNDFDAAAIQAKAAYDKMLSEMTAEEKKVIAKIQNWWKIWFMTAGHKRLGRIINGQFHV